MNKYRYQAETFPTFLNQWIPIQVIFGGLTLDECHKQIEQADKENKSTTKSPKRIVEINNKTIVWHRDSNGKITTNQIEK